MNRKTLTKNKLQQLLDTNSKILLPHLFIKKGVTIDPAHCVPPSIIVATSGSTDDAAFLKIIVEK